MTPLGKPLVLARLGLTAAVVAALVRRGLAREESRRVARVGLICSRVKGVIGRVRKESPPSCRRRAPSRSRARTISGGRPSRRAMRSTISSMTIMPCGPPKPRKAVCEVTLVLATRPVKLGGMG